MSEITKPEETPGVRGAGTGALLSSIHETQAHEGNRVKEPYRNSARHAFRCSSNAASVPSTITSGLLLGSNIAAKFPVSRNALTPRARISGVGVLNETSIDRS